MGRTKQTSTQEMDTDMNIHYMYPTFIFSLDRLKDPAYLCRFARRVNMQDYAYVFEIMDPWIHTVKTLKIGRSTSKFLGERIYRQAAWLPGWNQPEPSSSAGSDINNIKKLWMEEPNIEEAMWTKNNFIIKVWDVTGVANDSQDEARNSRLAENLLLDEYESVHGCLPIGNPKDTRNEMMRYEVKNSHWNSLIDEKTL